MLENEVIKFSGLKCGLLLKKNIERWENDWIIGECDIYVFICKLIIDIKCLFDIGIYLFFVDEVEDKVKKVGYDI